jgi:N utilization substance protein A
MDLKEFTSAISQIAEEKGIPSEKVIETIEMAIAAAYKKDYGEKGQVIKAKLDSESGDVKFWQVKLVVNSSMIFSEEELEKMKALSSDLSTEAKWAKAEALTKEREKPVSAETSADKEKVRFNPERHIMLNEAKKIKPKIKAGEELEILLETHKDYGRIAAQTAKQVILQRIREAERETILSEFKAKEEEIVSGIVQRVEGGNIFLDIGKTVGVLPREEQVPGEFYRVGQRLKVYLLKVEDSPKGPVIFLSRIYPKIISKLFELEVPEISQGQVVIKSIAREAGSRSKIAVTSLSESIDPIGSMVGQKGTRVAAVINELGGEKIDIIEWAEDSERYLANSLSPAKVLEVRIEPKNKAVVVVPEDQLSLAIGKDGQNVRLAAKLTGWKIDVRGPETEERAEVKESEEAEERVKKEPLIVPPKAGLQEGEEKKEKTKKKTKKEKKTKSTKI